MAFFGNFISIPIQNLLELLSSRSGVLKAEDYFKTYRLMVYEGRLVALELDGRAKEVGAAELLLLNLLDAGDSIFEFRTIQELDAGDLTRFQVASSEVGPGGLPLFSLAMGMAKVQDDLEHRAAELPHADTVYILDKPIEKPLEGSLKAFWNAAHQILEWGVSCREISVYSDYPLRSVQLCVLGLLGRGYLQEKPRENSSEQIQNLGDLVSFDGIDLV